MGNLFSVSISFDKLISCCSDCIARQPNYALQLEKNLLLLKNDWDELKSKRNDIKRRIEVEERDRRMKRHDEVDRWLVRVDEMEAEVEKVIRDGSQESLDKCFGGYCPKNCKTSYKLGRKVANKLQPAVAVLLSKGVFDVVTHQVSIPPIDERPAEVTLGLESTFDEVWKCIEDEQVGIMGLYGMGGVGKTTILTQVNNKLCNSTHQGFDVVIWIVVSKTPNPTTIQDDIGEKIGFRGGEWKNNSQENKAIDIFRILKKKKYVLLLDDLWKRLDLIEMGVPLPNPTNMSKVIFTTRSKEVCGHMEARRLIQVKCLGEEEAWALFQNKVGEGPLNAHPKIPELAKEVAKECDGLPLALITIGRAMACKMAPRDWHHAIEVLKGCTSAFSGMEEEVFSRLKFSYDCLPNDAIRSCFLYCSLYPEDYLISKEELIDKWICEDFLVKFDDLHKARNEGHEYIATLVRASLLEECFPRKVKMHDVIRDLAIWIGCECGAVEYKFIVQAGVGLTETPRVAKWEGAERVSLMKNKIVGLTGTPQCPKLLTLFLNNNNLHPLETIASGFLQFMPILRVLDLSCNRGLSRLPGKICELVSLQYLDVSSTDLEELPMEFQNLKRLKYLNLGRTRIHKISEQMLSSFKELQILKLDGFNFRRSVGLPNTFVKELETLEYLSDLKITITSDFALSDFSHSRKLTSITTSLSLYRFKGSRYLDLSFLKEMIRLESLHMRELYSIEEIIIGKGKASSSSSLHFFSMYFCPKLKELTWLASAPNLEKITIYSCHKMKTMVGGLEWDENAEEGARPIPFSKLTSLSLQKLPELESICPCALPFPCLKYMSVSDCSKLKKLPLTLAAADQDVELLVLKEKSIGGMD